MLRATTILVTSMLLATGPVMAESLDRVAYCDDLAEYAYIIMKNRQDGIPIVLALEADAAMHSSRGSAEAERELTRLLIRDAYGRQVERTDRLVDVASIEFREEAFANCLAATRD